MALQLLSMVMKRARFAAEKRESTAFGDGAASAAAAADGRDRGDDAGAGAVAIDLTAVMEEYLLGLCDIAKAESVVVFAHDSGKYQLVRRWHARRDREGDARGRTRGISYVPPPRAFRDRMLRRGAPILREPGGRGSLVQRRAGTSGR